VRGEGRDVHRSLLRYPSACPSCRARPG
jgi:hypothetical protein